MASSLLDHTLLSAHDPKTGRYDARRLAATLEISGKEMAAVVGYTPTGLSKNPASPRLQPKLRELVALLNRLRELLDGEMSLVRIWLKAPHPYLEGLPRCLTSRRANWFRQLILGKAVTSYEGLLWSLLS